MQDCEVEREGKHLRVIGPYDGPAVLAAGIGLRIGFVPRCRLVGKHAHETQQSENCAQDHDESDGVDEETRNARHNRYTPMLGLALDVAKISDVDLTRVAMPNEN